MWCAITKSDSNGAPWHILMAHHWCAISIWYTNGAPDGSAPLVTFFKKIISVKKKDY